jgi:hypothetical protein
MTAAGARRVALAVGVVLAGGLLGVVGRASDYMPEPLVLMFALGTPWLVVSFAAGWCAGDAKEGAAAGAAVLVVAVLTYYAVMLGLEARSGPRYAAAMGVLWGGFGALTGALFGAAGAALHRGGTGWRIASLSLLAGALVGEALLYLLRGHEQGMGQALLAAELALGLLLPFAFWRRPANLLPALTLTGAVAMLALVADASIRIFAHHHGWGG